MESAVAPMRHLSVTRDPHDNIFLDCADAARADYLITGNQKDFPGFWKQPNLLPRGNSLTLSART
jgi:uncharacterized protein